MSLCHDKCIGQCVPIQIDHSTSLARRRHYVATPRPRPFEAVEDPQLHPTHMVSSCLACSQRHQCDNDEAGQLLPITRSAITSIPFLKAQRCVDLHCSHTYAIGEYVPTKRITPALPGSAALPGTSQPTSQLLQPASQPASRPPLGREIEQESYKI